MKRLLMVFSVLLALSLVSVSMAFGANTLQQESGLNYIDPDIVQDGYPLFYYNYDGGSMCMIDLYGNLVHHWTTKDIADYTIVSLAWPLIWEDGNMIFDATYDTTGGSAAVSDTLVQGARGYHTILQLDWDSNLIADTGDALYDVNFAPHHDERKIYNKSLGEYTWLALTWQAYGADDAVALGADPTYEGNYGSGWSPDGLVEVNDAGDLIWRWSFADHLVQNYDATKTEAFTDAYGYANPGATFGEPADYPGKLNINKMNDNGGGPKKDWNHCNSIDYNPTLGHIVINAKDFSEIYVIDHDGTFVSTEDYTLNWTTAQSDAGDFLYRFGNPCNYDQGEDATWQDDGDHQFFGAHNIHWIGESAGSMYKGFQDAYGDIEGEGQFLLFDNHCWGAEEHASNVLQWNPFIADSEGTISDTYVNPPEAGTVASGGFGGMGGFGSGTSTSVNGYNAQCTWRFNGGTGFYGYHISGMMRMPNGNTHVCEGTQSHIFECTMDGDVAWEYYKPQSNSDYSGGSTFRSNKIPADHPTLAGRDLTPVGNFRTIVMEGDTPTADNELAKFLGTM